MRCSPGFSTAGTIIAGTVTLASDKLTGHKLIVGGCDGDAGKPHVRLYAGGA